jgi:hypothetical protein
MSDNNHNDNEHDNHGDNDHRDESEINANNQHDNEHDKDRNEHDENGGHDKDCETHQECDKHDEECETRQDDRRQDDGRQDDRRQDDRRDRRQDDRRQDDRRDRRHGSGRHGDHDGSGKRGDHDGSDKRTKGVPSRTIVITSPYDDTMEFVGKLNVENGNRDTKFVTFDTLENAETALESLVADGVKSKFSYYKMFFRLANVDLKTVTYDDLKEMVKDELLKHNSKLNVLFLRFNRNYNEFTGSGSVTVDLKSDFDNLLETKTLEFKDGGNVTLYKYDMKRDRRPRNFGGFDHGNQGGDRGGFNRGGGRGGFNRGGGRGGGRGGYNSRYNNEDGGYRKRTYNNHDDHDD